MQVGTAQSQSLIASVSVTRTSTTTVSATSLLQQDSAPADAVLNSVGGQIDSGYVQQVLQSEIGQSVANMLQNAGIEGEALDAVLSGAIDVSPQATAGRILDFATSFFGGFQANHAGQEGGAQIDGFSQLIKDAVDEGFQQSRDLLEGIGKISGKVAEDIDETYSLVMSGIDDFAQEQRDSLAPVPPPEEVPEEPMVI